MKINKRTNAGGKERMKQRKGKQMARRNKRNNINCISGNHYFANHFNNNRI